MSQYFPKTSEHFNGNIKVKLDFPNYAIKTELKRAAGIDTFNLAAKSDLAILKAEVDKIDIDKLKTFPVDLSKLRNIVNNNIVKKVCRIN